MALSIFSSSRSLRSICKPLIHPIMPNLLFLIYTVRYYKIVHGSLVLIRSEIKIFISVKLAVVPTCCTVKGLHCFYVYLFEILAPVMEDHLSHPVRKQFVSPRRQAKPLASLRTRAHSPEPSLFLRRKCEHK